MIRPNAFPARRSARRRRSGDVRRDNGSFDSGRVRGRDQLEHVAVLLGRTAWRQIVGSLRQRRGGCCALSEVIRESPFTGRIVRDGLFRLPCDSGGQFLWLV